MFGNCSVSVAALANEWFQQLLLLLLGAEILMMPPAPSAKVKGGIALLGPARVQHIHCGC